MGAPLLKEIHETTGEGSVVCCASRRYHNRNSPTEMIHPLTAMGVSRTVPSESMPSHIDLYNSTELGQAKILKLGGYVRIA